MSRNSTLVACLFTLVILGACEQPTEVVPLPSQSDLSMTQARPALEDLDAEWARVAQTEVPGFAGYWRAADGAYVTAVAASGNARGATDFVRARIAAPRFAVVRSQSATYPFDQLFAWKNQLLGLLSEQQVYWLDIDEVNNRLVFGVRDGRAGVAVLKAAAKARIPAHAVTFTVTQPPVPRTSLRDFVRPVVGGLQISSTAGTCTLGFNAAKQLENGFVTASHCSTSMFVSDGTVQHQNVSPNRIGTEIIDPFSPRRSDAAFYRYDAGISRDWGHIARTTFPAVNSPGSLTVDGANPKFRITSEATNAVQVVGELVNKMGRTSGWTQGQVMRTCVTLANLPCQWEARVWSEGGDSGSPMFQQTGPFEPEAGRVALWGILWGGPVGDFTITWYSTISSVEQDIGSLNTACDPEASICYPPLYAFINGPSTIKREGVYTWRAMAAHGDGTYSYSWERCDENGSNCTNEGTGSSVSYYFYSGHPHIVLRLTVTSAGQSVVDERTIHVLF